MSEMNTASLMLAIAASSFDLPDRISAWASLRCVISRAIIEAPTGVPALSKIGEIVADTEMIRPSLRRLDVIRFNTVSPRATHSRIAACSLSRSLGTNISSKLPRASAAL